MMSALLLHLMMFLFCFIFIFVNSCGNDSHTFTMIMMMMLNVMLVIQMIITMVMMLMMARIMNDMMMMMIMMTIMMMIVTCPMSYHRVLSAVQKGGRPCVSCTPTRHTQNTCREGRNVRQHSGICLHYTELHCFWGKKQQNLGPKCAKQLGELNK